MRKLLRILLVTLPLCSLGVPGVGSTSGEVTFTKLLDSETPIPGCLGPVGPFLYLIDDDGPGRRRLYGSPHLAMDDEGNLAFFGGGRIFSILGNRLHSVSRIGGELRHIVIDEGRVTFGILGGPEIGGIFRWEPGTAPFEVAGARTFVPGGGSCVFWTKEDGVPHRSFSIDGDAVLFTGTSNDEPISTVRTSTATTFEGTSSGTRASSNGSAGSRGS